MANLLYKNIGTNYKGFLNLDSTINTPLDATLRAVTDGMGNSSVLQLSTAAVTLGSGTITSNGLLTIKGSGSNIASFRDSSNVEKVYVADNGFIYGNYISITGGILGTQYVGFAQGTRITENSDGTLLFRNGSSTAFTAQLGGTTSSFPAIKRNGAAIDFRLADDSGYAALNANSLTLSGNLFLSSGNAIYAGTQLRIGAGAISILSDSAAGINFTAGASGRSFGISSATSGAPNSTAFLFVGDTATGVTMGANSINNASAILDLVSTTKGFLMPRQTTAQINAISTPAAGLQVYNTDLAQPCFYDGTGWRKVSHTTM